MLTNQHKLARRIVDQNERRTYMLHMCSLCHALGDEYGFPYRLVTNHDMLLLSMLVVSQSQDNNELVARRCPLNPLVKVNTYKNNGSAFAAAAAIELFRASQADHWLDSKGQNIAAFALMKVSETQHKKAKDILDAFGFDSSQTTNILASQIRAESEQLADAALPSATVSAALFAMSSELAKSPQNKASLARIGAAYGEYIYLKDALDDFIDDCLRGQFNPLKKFSRETTSELRIERGGIIWLLERLNHIEKTMRENLAQAHFTSEGRLLSRLLLHPVSLTTKALAERLKNMGDEIVFKRLGKIDALKALVMVAPIPMIIFAPRIIDDIKNFHLAHPEKAAHLASQYANCIPDCGICDGSCCTSSLNTCETSCLDCTDSTCTSCLDSTCTSCSDGCVSNCTNCSDCPTPTCTSC